MPSELEELALYYNRLDLSSDTLHLLETDDTDEPDPFLKRLVDFVYLPSRCSAGKEDGRPVECELCALHRSYRGLSFVHVHNAEFGDCFSMAPRAERQRRSWDWANADQDRQCLAYSLDSADRVLLSRREGTFLLSEDVSLRQMRLAARIDAAIDRTWINIYHDRPPPLAFVFGGSPLTPKTSSHSSSTTPTPPPAPKPLDLGTAKGRPQGKPPPPLWRGRPCTRCSLDDGDQSFVHVHVPELRFCFTFGWLEGKTVSMPGSEAPRLPHLDEDHSYRSHIQQHLESGIENALKMFYREQEHIARYRQEFRRFRKGRAPEVQPEKNTAPTGRPHNLHYTAPTERSLNPHYFFGPTWRPCASCPEVDLGYPFETTPRGNRCCLYIGR